MNQTTLDAMAFFLQKRNLTLDDVTYYRTPLPIHQHDPFYLKGMLPFVEMLHRHKEDTIVIHPDYDADGVLSGTLLEVALHTFGFKQVYVYPPNVSDGYGLNRSAIDRMLETVPDIKVLCTTDNGSNATDAVQYAQSKGLIVLVSDHHLAGDEPIGDVCVNPNGHGESYYPFRDISGTAVAYKIVQAYRHVYHTDTYREDVFSLFRFLVGVSVLSDVMPLHDENRYFVQEAIQVTTHALDVERVSFGTGRIADFQRGVYYLLQVLKREGKFQYGINADTFGFYVGPMLNSPRRMLGTSLEGFRAFQVPETETTERADALFSLNEQRKAYVSALTRHVFEDVVEPTDHMVFAVDMLHGVAGLIASAFTNTYQLPSIAFAYEGDVTDDTVLVGSGRAPNGFHLHDFVTMIQDVYPDLIESFGGHASAIGMRIRYKHLQAFSEVFTAYYRNRQTTSFETDMDVSTCDFVLPSPSMVTPAFEGAFYLPPTRMLSRDPFYHELVETVHLLEPYGHLFEAPIYGLTFTPSDVASFRYMGKQSQHVCINLHNGAVLLFWSARKELEPYLESKAVVQFVTTGHLEQKTFRSDVTVQYTSKSLRILDIPY